MRATAFCRVVGLKGAERPRRMTERHRRPSPKTDARTGGALAHPRPDGHGAGKGRTENSARKTIFLSVPCDYASGAQRREASVASRLTAQATRSQKPVHLFALLRGQFAARARRRLRSVEEQAIDAGRAARGRSVGWGGGGVVGGERARRVVAAQKMFDRLGVGECAGCLKPQNSAKHGTESGWKRAMVALRKAAKSRNNRRAWSGFCCLSVARVASGKSGLKWNICTFLRRIVAARRPSPYL